MSLTLDPQTEHRIHQEAERRQFATPDDLINCALDTLAGNAWTDEERDELDRRYDESMAAFDRGEGVPGDKVREMLGQLRAARLG